MATVLQGAPGVVMSLAADGPIVTNTTTPTSMLVGQITLPPLYINQIGQEFKVYAVGRISTFVTTPGTLTFDLRLGGTIVAQSPAFALNVVAKTNVGWILDWDLSSRAVVRGGAAAAATLEHMVGWTSEAVIGSPLQSVGGVGMLLSGGAVGTGFDNTVAQQLDFFVTWSVANAANSIRTNLFRVFSYS